MFYQRSMEIEVRLQAVLNMIRAGEFSTPAISAELGVSVPTVSRAVQALRNRGHRIRSVRSGGGWRFVIDEARSEQKRSPLSAQ